MLNALSSSKSRSLATGRPVLFWRPDSDESHVQADLGRAAEFLHLPPEAVVAAIDSGEPLKGWFVDWQVVPTA